jgi:hypothetical protein
LELVRPTVASKVNVLPAVQTGGVPDADWNAMTVENSPAVQVRLPDRLPTQVVSCKALVICAPACPDHAANINNKSEPFRAANLGGMTGLQNVDDAVNQFRTDFIKRILKCCRP